MVGKMICKCNHSIFEHGQVGCLSPAKDIGHWYCDCQEFKADNLKYLEMKAAGEI
jgi:hypothetical protein